MRALSTLSRLACLLTLLVLPCLPVLLAIQQNLAGIVDWHRPLIGEPLLTPTPPTFVESPTGNKIVAITKKNILAVLDDAGDIVWRQELQPQDPPISFHIYDDGLLLLSGPSATTARMFDFATGKLRWEKTLLVGPAHLVTPSHLGTGAVLAGGSVLVLSEGARVTKLDATSGDLLWAWEFPGGGSTTLLKSILVEGDKVFLLGITSSFATPTLSHITLNLETVHPMSDLSHVGSTLSDPSDAILARSAPSAKTNSPGVRVVWAEHGRIRVAPLLADGTVGDTKDFLPGDGRKYAHLIDVGMASEGYVIAQLTNGQVDVIEIGDKARAVEHFEESKNSPDAVVPIHSAVKKGEEIQFSRVSWSFSLGQLIAQIISVKPSSVISTGYSVQFDTASHGIIVAARPIGGDSHYQKHLVTTSTGAIQLLSPEKTLWTREESLADLKVVRFVDLGEPETEEVREIISDESFLGRLTRHAAELKDLPTFITRFVQRFTSSYTSVIQTTPLTADRLHRDQFGFQKLAIAITTGGKIFALDSANGNIIWSKNLGVYSETGSELEVIDAWVVRELGDAGDPTIAVLALKNEMTVGYHVNAFTGEVAGDKDQTSGLPLGKEICSGRPKTAFVTRYENCGTQNRVVAVLDSDDTLRLFPGCKKVASNIAADGLSLHVLERSLSSPILKGYSTVAADSVQVSTSVVWSRPLVNQRVIDVSPLTPSAIASYGRALGDKSTLYKYLNPHLIVVSAVDDHGSQGHVYVVDSVSGATVYEVQLGNVDTSAGILAVMVENWLVYAWLESPSSLSAGSLGGWRLGSVELFEDRSGGKKADTPGLSSFASGHDVTATSQTFIAPGAIRSMAFTTSKFGVTAKDLIFINSQSQLVSIPRRLLDPRRPLGKPSSADKEEMLIPYDSFIPPEPKRVVSHRYPLVGMKHITSSPALLESTSLVLAYGTDVFCTRGLAPSGTFDILSDGFNKAQLLLTLAALSVGIAVARPAVQRKLLRAKWF